MARGEFLRIQGLARLVSELITLANEAVNEETLEEIGLFLTHSILKRTAEGKGADGDFFEPYTPKYRLFRLKKAILLM